MKISTASKKVLASALSAAMVVAFAPTVAFGAVSQDTTDEAVSTDKGDVVATVTYKDGKKVIIDTFYSDKTTSDDDALQAALIDANAHQSTATSETVVTLAKDITVGDGFGGDDFGVDSDKTLRAAGTFTIDLGGHTIKNAVEKTGITEEDALVLGLGADQLYSYGAQAKVAYGYAGTPSQADISTKTFYTADGKQLAAGTLTFGDGGNVTSWSSSNTVYIEQETVANGEAVYVYREATAAEIVAGVNLCYKYTVNYTVPVTGTLEASDADDVITIKNGTIESVNGENAVRSSKQNVTLGEGAVVKAAGAAAIDIDGDVLLQEGASVEATNKKAAVAAIVAGTVTVDRTAAQKKAKASARDTYATVKATVTKADEVEDVAVAIAADEVKILAGADISASSDYAPSTSTGIIPGIINIGGVIYDITGNNAPVSAAVIADDATLNYGTYTADCAVIAEGTINYGTYNGYVVEKMDVNGGKFKYDPRIVTYAEVDGSVEEVSAIQDLTDRKVTNDDAYFYVYRAGKVGSVDDSGIPAGIYVDALVPEGAKDANGNPYLGAAALDNYINDKYLTAKTAEVVLSQDEVGVNLNDGNETDTLDLNFAVSYANPYSAKDVAANQAAFDVLNAQAEAAKQHVQGLYTVSAELDYGTDAKGKAVKYQDVESLGDAVVTIAIAPVTVDSKATIYKVGETATALETSTANAILPGAVWAAKANTAELGTYGVTYSTAEDLADEAAQKAAEEAQKQIDELSKELGTVIDTQGKTIDELNAIIASLKAELADKAASELVATQDRNAVENVYATKTKTVKLAKGVTKTKKAQTITYKTKVSASGNVVTYAKRSGSSKITVAAGGTVKLAKSVKAGTYSAKVKVTCGEQTRTVTVMFVVK